MSTAMDWDLTSYFPQFDGEEMRQFRDSLSSDLQALCQRARQLSPLDSSNGATWEDVFLQAEKIAERLSHLGSYLGCLSAADAKNEEYSRQEAAFALLEAEGEKLDVELLRALKNADDALFADFADRPALRDAGYFLQRQRTEIGRAHV